MSGARACESDWRWTYRVRNRAKRARPVLVVWDTDGKMMPNRCGRRLAESFPNSKLIELPDCYTLIPEDQPEQLAATIVAFVVETSLARSDERES